METSYVAIMHMVRQSVRFSAAMYFTQQKSEGTETDLSGHSHAEHPQSRREP